MQVSEISSPAPLSPAARAARINLPAWILSLADTYRHWLMLGVLAIYLLGFNGQWRVERDSAFYLSIGRNLAEGRGYTYQGQAEHLAFPGLPLFFATTFKLAPRRAVQVDLALMLLMGFATLALVYRLFLLHAGRPTAVMVTFGVAITRLFYRYNFELLSDLPFLMGVMAFLVGYESSIVRRKSQRTDAEDTTRAGNWPVFDGFLMVAGLIVAVAMRPAMWALLLAIGLTTLWSLLRPKSGRSSPGFHLMLVLLAVGAGALFLSLDLRHGEAGSLPDYEDFLVEQKLFHPWQTTRQMLTQNVPDLCEATLAKGFFGCRIGPGLNTLAALLVVGLSFWLLAHNRLWGIWALLTLGLMLFFKPVDRYLLPVLPLLVYAWWRFLLWMHGRLPLTWGNRIFAVLLIGGSGTNLARLGEIIVFEQRPVPFLAHYHDGRYVSLYAVGKLVNRQTRPDDWILVAPHVGRPMTFVSHRDGIRLAAPTLSEPPAGARMFALIGPSWLEAEEVKDQPDSTVPEWVSEHGYTIGPQVGPTIQNFPDAVPWTLQRVEKK